MSAYVCAYAANVLCITCVCYPVCAAILCVQAADPSAPPSRRWPPLCTSPPQRPLPRPLSLLCLLLRPRRRRRNRPRRRHQKCRLPPFGPRRVTSPKSPLPTTSRPHCGTPRYVRPLTEALVDCVIGWMLVVVCGQEISPSEVHAVVDTMYKKVRSWVRVCANLPWLLHQC